MIAEPDFFKKVEYEVNSLINQFFNINKEEQQIIDTDLKIS